MSEFNNFDDFMDVTEPTLRTGSVTTGFLNAWGTAGKASSGWVLFEQNFYDPRSRGLCHLKMFGIKIVEVKFVDILNLSVGDLKAIVLLMAKLICKLLLIMTVIQI